jgi:hypothetical protein
METKRSIELEEDFHFERRDWKAQRIGWVIMILVVIAAMLGLTGRGPLSSRKAADSSGKIKLEYEKFLHYNSPAQIHVQLTGSEQEEKIMLVLERDFVRDIGLEQIVPEPETQVLSNGHMTYTFSKTEAAEPVLVTLHINPRAYGNKKSVIQTPGGEVIISQFIYP